MSPSLKKGVAVHKKAKSTATRTAPVLSPKTKKACLLKATKTSSSHRTPALGDDMAVDPINSRSCALEIDSSDDNGTGDEHDDEKQLGAWPVQTHDLKELSEQ
jgi:hypothetical protein